MQSQIIQIKMKKLQLFKPWLALIRFKLNIFDFYLQTQLL